MNLFDCQLSTNTDGSVMLGAGDYNVEVKVAAYGYTAPSVGLVAIHQSIAISDVSNTYFGSNGGY